MSGRLKQLDAYSKTLDDFRIRTTSGGFVTLFSSILIVFLVFYEIHAFTTTDTVQILFVDTNHQEKLNISIDIKFNSLPCNYLTIDAMDVSGESHTDIIDHLYKSRLTLDGKPMEDDVKKVQLTKLNKTQTVLKDNSSTTTTTTHACESCYGAESALFPCCASCHDVKDAYEAKGWSFDPTIVHQCAREGIQTMSDISKSNFNEACRIHGFLQVNKVSGNFHIAPGQSFERDEVHVHSLRNFHFNRLNTSHEIFDLTFGEKFPKQVNPLTGTKQISERGAVLYHYYIKVVPTTYIFLNGSKLITNQYSVTKHRKIIRNVLDASNQQLPGTFFTYDISAIMVKYVEEKRSFAEFMTSLCTIVGGVLTLSTLIDTFLYRTSNFIAKNSQ